MKSNAFMHHTVHIRECKSIIPNHQISLAFTAYNRFTLLKSKMCEALAVVNITLIRTASAPTSFLIRFLASTHIPACYEIFYSEQRKISLLLANANQLQYQRFRLTC